MNFTERSLGRALQRDVFNREVCVVDNCLWTGYETDLLIVEPNLRLIDVELKISRADLKADRHKDKWRDISRYRNNGRPAEPVRKLWPRDVWKHYYAMPEEVWQDDLAEHLGSPNCGVLTFTELNTGVPRIVCQRRAKPNKDARQLTPAEVLDIARLTSLRLWNAYAIIDKGPP